MHAPSPSDTTTHQTAAAALEALAAALGPDDFATTLAPGPGGSLRLTVTSRRTQLSEHISTDGMSYFWSWAEPIGPTTDPQAAATKIAAVLRARPQAAVHG